MITVDLYHTSDDARVADKTLSAIATDIPINPTAAIDRLKPVFVIDYSDSYIGVNYVYCSAFGRYYFCSSPSIEIGRRIILPCTVDALTSWITQLRNCPCTVTRSETAGITAVPDAQLPIDPNKRLYRVMAFDAESSYPFDINAANPYLLEVL